MEHIGEALIATSRVKAASSSAVVTCVVFFRDVKLGKNWIIPLFMGTDLILPYIQTNHKRIICETISEFWPSHYNVVHHFTWSDF